MTPPKGPSIWARICIAVVLAVLTGSVAYVYSVRFRPNAGDIGMPLCMGRALLQGIEPFAHCQTVHSDGKTPTTANPITTVLAVMPLLPLPPMVAAAVFIGLSTGLLSYGLTKDGFERLLVLLAFPFWQALQVVQWSPLLFASALLPVLLPITLAKPHVGAPIALTRLTWRRCLACCLFLGVSFLVYPTWPLMLLQHIGAEKDYQMPLFSLPFGPLIGLAVLRLPSQRAALLLLLALAPQRLFYDLFLLWLIPQTRREIIVLVGLSWLCYFVWYFWPTGGSFWIIGLLYLPCVVMVLKDRSHPGAYGQGLLDPRRLFRSAQKQ